MILDIAQVDAFTTVPFTGNPAGVVPRADTITEDVMQRIAREMALSETAFVCRTTTPDADLRVRFFTPTQEIDLCGHATIATFFFLAQSGLIPEVTGKALDPDGITLLRQETRAGLLPVRIQCRAGRVERVMMTQSRPLVLATDVKADDLATVLGLEPEDIRDANVPPQIIATGVPDLLVPLNGLDALRRCRPDMGRLQELMARHDLVSVHPFTLEAEAPDATAQGRDFAPAVGIPEEAATGTANGALGVYLVLNGLVRSDGDTVEMVMEQGHTMGRPSRIVVEVDQDLAVLRRDGGEPRPGRWAPAAAIREVRVGGQAVTVFQGTMSL
ncbi:MAG: PhzF family phenazine biosynthesis protein [Symbiobacteriia bacterium]